jgi:hypothetical protein
MVMPLLGVNVPSLHAATPENLYAEQFGDGFV